MAKTIEAGAVQNEQTLNNQEQFFLKYRKQILIAVAAILLIVAGCLAYKTFVAEPRENKASTAMAKAQEMFAERDFQKALNGDKTNEGFLSVIENYGGTDAANLAKGYAGLCYAQMGKWQEAVKYLEDFSPKGDAIISPAIVAALGNAYANTGKVDEAISTLKEAASMADSRSESVNNTTSPTYLLQAARLLESQKKTDEALKIYKQIKEKYVNSAVAQDIDKYIERASK
jgi:tetratricopeptide (TPR) repeat protein